MSEMAKNGLLLILLIAVMVVVLTLTGCAQLAPVRQQGAEIADGALEGGLYATCTAATVGSLIRRYGRDPDGRAAWEILCGHEWSRNGGEIELPEISR